MSGLGLASCLAVPFLAFRTVPAPDSFAISPPPVPSGSSGLGVVADFESVMPGPGPGLAPHFEPLVLESVELGRGGTLGGALDRVGLDPGTREAVLRVARRHLDLRRLPPQTGIALWRESASREALAVSIRNEPTRFLRVWLSAGAGEDPATELIELPVVTTLETAAGAVRTSLAQALSSTIHASNLVPAIADVFQWDIDLLVDPRVGDEIRVAFEVVRFGELPADLPNFGGSASRAGDFVDIGRILAATYEGRIARSSAFWVAATADGPGDYFDADGRALRKSFLRSPLNYRRISSRFSRARLNPVTRKVVPHHGVDFAAAPGTPVVATADGRVVSAGWDGPLGRAIRLRHGSEYSTIYGHLQRIARGIRPGAEVRQNEVIGYVGSSGRATGPHLHYALLRSGSAIDPMRFESPEVAPLDPALLPQLEAARMCWIPRLAGLVIGDEEGDARVARGHGPLIERPCPTDPGA